MASGGGFQNGFSYPFDYYSILPMASVNNSGESVFLAYEAELSFDPFLGSSFGLGDGLLATASQPPNSSFNESFLSTINPATLRPMIADNGNIVAKFGNKDNSPILLFDNDINLINTIAASSQFNEIGQSPGIRDDGKIITFYRDLNSKGASALKTNPGKGIFAAIYTVDGGTESWRIERIAGISGNGYLDPGETFEDKNKNGKFDTGDVDIGVFSDFDAETRVAVNSTQDTQRAALLHKR